MTTNTQDTRAELVLEIARREAVLANARAERKAGLLAGVAMPASEPNRNWHIYALGADLFEPGLRGQDAGALMGLRSMPVTRVVRLLLDAEARMPGLCRGPAADWLSDNGANLAYRREV